jgi:D-alanine-D-alanine ligase
MATGKSDKIRVAVIMGGTSNEREVSLKSGRAVVNALSPVRYRVKVYDPAVHIPKLVRDAKNLDVALIMMHGRGGEDGSMQGLLDILGVPYQSAGVLGCALAMNKPMTKDRFRQAGLPVARDLLLTAYGLKERDMVFTQLGLPVVVKPENEGSSYGITIVHYKKDLLPALRSAFAMDRKVLVEEFLDGRELTCGVIGNDKLDALPLIEIIPNEKYNFFDYEAKYQPGASQEICPAEVDAKTTAKVQQMAIQAHQALGLVGYSRTDFILTKKGPHLLETNTIPGMTETSLLPLAAKNAGMDFSALVNRLINLALERAGA